MACDSLLGPRDLDLHILVLHQAKRGDQRRVLDLQKLEGVRVVI